MAVTQGQYGRVHVFDHFTSPDNDLTWGSGTVKVGNFGFVSVNEGSYEWTVDEANGVVAFTTDTGDNDNACLTAGTSAPTFGNMITEARYKFNSATLGAVFHGFTETLSLATPVMPAEFATATMTYNGSGGMIGAQFDTDATTNDFRACAGDGSAATGTIRGSTNTNGIRANETIAADEWYITRTELWQGGHGAVWVGHKGRGLDMIAEWTGAPVTNTDLFSVVCMFENRSSAARVFEVDYLSYEAGMDWEVT
jgi:hypothetical protein